MLSHIFAVRAEGFGRAVTEQRLCLGNWATSHLAVARANHIHYWLSGYNVISRLTFLAVRRFLEVKLTNAIVEGSNSKIRMISHRAFGFHSAAALIAMIYLNCSNIVVPF